MYEPTIQEQLYDKLIHLDKCHKALNVWQIRYTLFKKTLKYFEDQTKLKLVNKYLHYFLIKHGDPASDQDYVDIFFPNAIKMRKQDEN